MNRNFNRIIGSLLLSTVMLFTEPASAAETIKEQPISIYADRLSIDDTTGISLYRGHVELQQGDLKFSGDELDVTQKEGVVTQVQARGTPARFERSVPKPLKGESNRIDYDNSRGEVVLRGNARLWQDGDQFNGEIIHYDTNSRRVQAQGSSSDDSQTRERVHVLIRPKSDQADKSEEDKR